MEKYCFTDAKPMETAAVRISILGKKVVLLIESMLLQVAAQDLAQSHPDRALGLMAGLVACFALPKRQGQIQDPRFVH